MSLSILLQFGPGWKLEIRSLLIGVFLGILAAALFHWAWPKALFRYQKAAAWVRRKLAWVQSKTEVRFREEIANNIQKHHLGKSWAPLQQLFVQPRISVPQGEINLSRAIDWGAEQISNLWPELAAGIATPEPPTIGLRDLLIHGQRTVVAAPMGAGKTTLLAYCAYFCATAADDSPDAALRAFTPLFVHLAELHLKPPPEPDPEDPDAAVEVLSAAEQLIQAIHQRSGPMTAPGIKGLLQEKLASGKIVLLLDGWDELPASQHQLALDWLTQLLELSPDIRVVVAMPTSGYGPLLDLGFTVTGLRPWRARQMEQLAAAWKESAAHASEPQRSVYWAPHQSAFENSVRLWLATAGLEAEEEETPPQPKRLVDLMAEGLRLFCHPNENVKNGETDQEQLIPDPMILALWQRLAFTIVHDEKLSLSQDEISAAIKETAAEFQSSERADISRLAKSLNKNGMFTKWGDGSLGFISKNWRDYLAAGHMAQHGLSDTAIRQLNDPGWQDILRYYTSLAGAAELANSLLSTNGQSVLDDQLFQVASWVAEAPDSGNWRRQTMIQLGKIARQPNSNQVVRLRAAVALAHTKEAGVVTFLTQLLERSDPILRLTGTSALSHLIDDDIIGVLTKMLSDDNELVRQAAVEALAWSAHPKAERPLLLALVRGDDEMGRIAAEGFAYLGSEGAAILKEAAEDDDLRVRRASAHGLALLDEEWVAPILKDMERDSEWLVTAAATGALDKIKSRAFPSPWLPPPIGRQRWLFDYAKNTGEDVPSDRSMAPYLARILSESSETPPRVLAALSIGQLGDRRAVPALKTAAANDDAEISEAAIVALCQIKRAFGKRPAPAPTPPVEPPTPEPSVPAVEDVVADDTQGDVDVK